MRIAATYLDTISIIIMKFSKMIAKPWQLIGMVTSESNYS